MADNKIDYFSGVRDHFNSLETQVIEVPEWGLVGDMAIHTNTDLIVLIDVIIEKALTKDGEKMFNAGDVLGFKKKADTNVIAEVATKIMGTGNPDLEDYKKN